MDRHDRHLLCCMQRGDTGTWTDSHHFTAPFLHRAICIAKGAVVWPSTGEDVTSVPYHLIRARYCGAESHKVKQD